ncbi:MAG: cellulase family glycosylhydrolase [Chloroflexi bacterium]|nr:cellulase family glycosylhydrolase [Chloroflexota bacterium]
MSNPVRGMLILFLLLALVILVAWQARDYITDTLVNLTGEEDHVEQIKGLGALILLRFTQAPLELAPYVPIQHTGINPFGINTFLEQEVEPEKVERSLRMIRDAGFHWIRQEFPWEDIEISGKGDFWDHKWNVSAWAKYDRIVELANQYGLEIIARLDNPPAWSRARGDEIGTRAPPDNFEDFGDFVYAVVSRYKGKIRYYQIWNEPNIYPEWGEQPPDPEGYVELLRIAYQRAKEADPNCVILCAGLAQTIEHNDRNMDDLMYLQRMYDAGAAPYFDIMGVMAYGLWTGPTDRRVSPDRTNFARPQLIRDIMVRNGDAHKPIWATEIGWNALPSDFPGVANFGRVTLEKQAEYAVQAYQRAQDEWPWMGVMNYWFFKRATDAERDQSFYYFRLVEPDFTPLPVYEALRDYAHQPPVMSIGYHQESHWSLQYSGNWITVRDDQAVLGAYKIATEPESTLNFVFKGTDLDLVVLRQPESGRILVSIQGCSPKEIDLHSPTLVYGEVIPLARGLPNQKHSVEIRLLSGTAAIDGVIVRRGEAWGHNAFVAVLFFLLLLAVVVARSWIKHSSKGYANA